MSFFKMNSKVVKAFILGGVAVLVLIIVINVGLSATSTPGFCGSCHLMEGYQDTWAQSNHKQFACVDCHLPHEYPELLVEKSKSGISHVYHNTLLSYPEVLELKDHSVDILVGNCIECHQSTVENFMDVMGSDCLRCHTDLVHKDVNKLNY